MDTFRFVVTERTMKQRWLTTPPDGPLPVTTVKARLHPEDDEWHASFASHHPSQFAGGQLTLYSDDPEFMPVGTIVTVLVSGREGKQVEEELDAEHNRLIAESLRRIADIIEESREPADYTPLAGHGRNARQRVIRVAYWEPEGESTER